MLMLYVPLGTLSARKYPAALVVVVVSTPVARWRNKTAAPGMAACDESMMVPSIEPVVCASSEAANATANNNVTISG